MALSNTERSAIKQAIEQAEAKTSGEIFAVLAEQSDDYLFVSFFWAAFWSLILGLVAALAAPLFWIELDAITLSVAQIMAFAAIALIAFFIRSFRMMMVPPFIRERRARRNAREQFLAHGLHLTKDRTGVLIFVSKAEHYAEIIADEGISAHVPDDQWQDIVSTMIEEIAANDISGGFVGAINASGAFLAEHFPPRENDENELSDHLVEL